MKLSVVFPSVMYREGPEGMTRLMQGIEEIGFDGLDMFDHVVMGYPTENRQKPFYPPTMPVMEAFMVLAFAAAVTNDISLGTGVLVLPQRQPTLVAKQVSTLDTLSAGRIRLGVGIGWQRSEYEALQEDFATRGKRMEEAIELLRLYWGDEHINFDGTFYKADEIAMEPKSPQGADLPIWIGGTKPAALQRIARLADGWMAMSAPGDPPLAEQVERLNGYLREANRNPAEFGMQMSLSPDANINRQSRAERQNFYTNTDLLRRRLAELIELGFDHLSLDCVPIFQAGYRTSDALLEQLDTIHSALLGEVGKS